MNQDSFISSARKVDPFFQFAYMQALSVNEELQVEEASSVAQLALFDWYVRHGGTSSKSTEAIRKVRTTIAERSFTCAVERLSAHHAALIWASLKSSILEVVDKSVQTPATVSTILGRFESAMKRWRYDSSDLKQPINWAISSEREVQDILWLILRSIWDDVQDEDTLPKFGHSTYKADFGIPSLGVIVEAKYARAASDFKSIEKEILEDLIPYRNGTKYSSIIVFIYDESCSVQHHEETRIALRSVTGISDVIVVSRPSQLPSATNKKA